MNINKEMTEEIIPTYLAADLNDKRLTNRFNEILRKLPNNINGSIIIGIFLTWAKQRSTNIGRLKKRKYALVK